MMRLKHFGRLLTTLSLAAGMAALAAADTHAVLIGINDYPDAVGPDGKPLTDEKGNPINTDLRGAVNDVTAFRKILLEKFGVEEDNIHLVTDKEAGEAGFIGAMKKVLEAIEPGDQFVFYYSGHGGQINAADEPDGVEEVLVLADNQLVPGDFFGELSKVLTEANIDCTFIFDSCYSGGMSRDGQRVKFLDIRQSKAHHPVAPARLTGLKATPKAAPARQEKGDFIFVFAGQEDQPTIDISGLKDIPAHGVFTLFLTAVLTDLPAAPAGELVEAVAAALKELKFEQIPRIEASTPERTKAPVVADAK